MKDASWEIQTAIVSLIKAHMPEYPVWDRPEAGTAFPYITVNDIDLNSSTKGQKMQKVTFQVHLWSSYAGKKEIKAMKTNVMQHLVNGALDSYLTAFTVPELHYQDCIIIDEPETGIVHGILNFVIITAEV